MTIAARYLFGRRNAQWVTPLSDNTRAHGSHTVATFWKDQLVRLLNETGEQIVATRQI